MFAWWLYTFVFNIIYMGSYLLDFLWYREVEDFARRLNSDWPERMQEFLTGQERTSMLFATNGNGFLRRNTCMLFYLFAVIWLIRDTRASWTFKFLFYNCCFVLFFSSWQIFVQWCSWHSIPFIYKLVLSFFMLIHNGLRMVAHRRGLTLAFTASICCQF